MFEKPKSAPASAVLKELLEGKKLTREQQLQVLEYRREILVRCMKTFSMNTIGQLTCMDSGNLFYHDLYNDTPRVTSIDNQFNLDSRGLYAGNNFSQQNGRRRFTFGIDHESWLLIKITYLKEERTDRLDKYERAEIVQVIRTDLSTILEEMKIEVNLIQTYFDITVDEWVSRRKRLYEDACKVKEGMDVERAILRLAT